MSTACTPIYKGNVLWNYTQQSRRVEKKSEPAFFLPPRTSNVAQVYLLFHLPMPRGLYFLSPPAPYTTLPASLRKLGAAFCLREPFWQTLYPFAILLPFAFPTFLAMLTPALGKSSYNAIYSIDSSLLFFVPNFRGHFARRKTTLNDFPLVYLIGVDHVNTKKILIFKKSTQYFHWMNNFLYPIYIHPIHVRGWSCKLYQIARKLC